MPRRLTRVPNGGTSTPRPPWVSGSRLACPASTRVPQGAASAGSVNKRLLARDGPIGVAAVRTAAARPGTAVHRTADLAQALPYIGAVTTGALGITPMRHTTGTTGRVARSLPRFARPGGRSPNRTRLSLKGTGQDISLGAKESRCVGDRMAGPGCRPRPPGQFSSALGRHAVEPIAQRPQTPPRSANPQGPAQSSSAARRCGRTVGS